MIALLAPLVVQAVAAGFAPPLDRPIAYSVSEVRQQDAKTSRFVIQRRVTFQTAPDGFVAEVETLAVTGNAGRAGEMFEAMARSALGRRIAITLDRDGKPVDVTDLDAVWDAQLAAMASAQTSKDPALATVVTSLLAPLRSLPRPAKVARIGEMVASLVADRHAGLSEPHNVTVPARGQNGATAMLAGTERTIAAPGGMLLFERRAEGIVAGTPTALSQSRRFDPRTGLVGEATTISTVTTGDARLIITRSLRVTP